MIDATGISPRLGRRPGGAADNAVAFRLLGVSTTWIEGCIQGFAGEAAQCDGDDYRAGYHCGGPVLEDIQEGWKWKPQLY
jgi:hypothetical protein